ncbi:fatty acid desaturase [Marinobacteraceae bacterium S3BR75-40.1]
MNAAVKPENAPGGAGLEDERAIRARIRQDLPKDTFQTQPWRALWYLPLSAAIVGGIVAILTLGLPWWANTLIGLAVGHCIVAQAFLAHEVLHGALGLPRGVQTFLGWLGFGPMVVPPEFWRRWHNVAHHGNTNQGDKDPDSFGTMKRYRHKPALKRFLKLAPGSGTWYSYLFLTYSFTFHAQLVLWLQARRRPELRGFNRHRAMAQSIALALGWIALAVVSGPLAIFTVVIPFMLANTISQSYILTNHFLRPQTERNNPVDNSMSVRTWRWLDPLHFRFSHHVEHHLFPRMSSNKAPRVRQWLETTMPECYVAPTHWQALRYLYGTPRVYLTPTVLVDPDNMERQVDLAPLQPVLQGKG